MPSVLHSVFDKPCTYQITRISREAEDRLSKLEPAGDPMIEPPPEEHVIDEPVAEMEEPTDETAMAALENTAEGLVDESPVNQEPASIDENPKKYLSEQRYVVELYYYLCYLMRLQG
jgi:hypothetical protein